MRTMLMCLIMMSGLAHAGGLGSGDICAVRPDLCDNNDASVSVLARQARRQPAARPARAASLNAQNRVSTCRPSTVDLTGANQNLPVCGSALTSGRAPAAAPVAAISFASYMNANAANPALSRRVAGYQNAFKDTAKPAVFTAPDVEGNGTREGAAPTVSSGPQARNQ